MYLHLSCNQPFFPGACGIGLKRPSAPLKQRLCWARLALMANVISGAFFLVSSDHQFPCVPQCRRCSFSWAPLSRLRPQMFGFNSRWNRLDRRIHPFARTTSRSMRTMACLSLRQMQSVSYRWLRSSPSRMISSAARPRSLTYALYATRSVTACMAEPTTPLGLTHTRRGNKSSVPPPPTK